MTFVPISKTHAYIDTPPTLKYYLSQPTLSIDTLSSLPPQSLPESWTVAAKHPLTIVKLRILNTTGVPRVDVVITVSVQDDLTWGLSVQNNPSVHEFKKNTQTLRVINSFCKGPVSGNCRGNRSLTLSRQREHS